MDISMWILFDALARFHPSCDITDGSMSLKGFRLLSDEISGCESFACIKVHHDNYEAGTGRVVITHGSDTIIVTSVKILELLNSVVQTFDRYRAWNGRLQKARNEIANFQAVLNIAHEIFRCPLFFGNISMNLYAITRQYEKAQVFEEWDEVKRLRTMPVPLLEKLKAYDFPKQFPEEVDPAVMPSWPEAKFEHQIRIGCYMDGALWGHFYMYSFEKHVTAGMLQLGRFVADTFGQMLQENREKGEQHYSKFSWLVDILNGQIVSRESLAPIYMLMDWSETDALILYKITSDKSGYDKSIRYWITDNISDISGIIVFPYENSVIIIAREGDMQSQRVRDRIIKLIGIGDHHCGISFSFKGLQNIAEYYKQADSAVRLAPNTGDKVHMFNDCVLEGLAIELKAHIKWRDWITPSLINLIELDAAQRTEYYITLYCLLVNKGHLGNTAKALYIHRNTLLYRLDKLEQILNIDINDESVVTYLRLCYALLKDDYPISFPLSVRNQNS